MFEFRRNKEKIFCIGRNKTGTTTVERVLKDFGYKLGNQAKAELLLSDYQNGNWKAIIQYCRTADAFQDVPFSWPYTWLILHEHFPGAKFILTTRGSESWYQSITSFHAKQFGKNDRIPGKHDLQNAKYRYKGFMWDANRAVWKTPENDVYNKKLMVGNYERHNEDIRHFFSGKKNFIEIDVTNDKDYTRLAVFLDQNPVDGCFPHLNKTA